MTRRIAVINEKGGSGKTTLTSNVASYLALRRGRRVLAIDLDPQGQLAKVLGVEARRTRSTALALLVDQTLGREPLDDSPNELANSGLPIAEGRVQGLDVVVASKELGIAPQLAGPESDPSGHLARRLSSQSELGAYDLVLIDSPPSFGILTLNILRAVDELVLPVPLTSLGLDGCRQLLESVELVRTRYDHPLAITQVVPTFWRRTRMAAELLDQLRARFPKEISSIVLGFDVKIDEAQARGRSIFETAPSCRGARAFAALGDELELRVPALVEAW